MSTTVEQAPPCTEPTGGPRWDSVLPHRQRLLRLARSKGAIDPEDCVQEALLRVATHPGLDEQRVAGLLTTVLLRLCVDQHRATVRLRAAAPRLATPDHTTGGADDTVCDNAEAAWLRSCVQDLPDRERQVIQRRAVGLTARQTAADLGVTYKAAEGALTRARTRLQATWRLTLSLLGIALAPRLRGRGQTAVLLATPVALLLALTPFAQQPADTRRQPPSTAALTGTPAGPADLPDEAAAPPAQSSRPEPPPVAVPDAAPPPPSARATPASTAPTPPITTGPIGDKAVVGTDGVSITDQRTDESLTDTVQRCLDRGVILTLEESRCAD